MRTPPTMRLPLAIFLLLAGLYLLTTGGHTYASDEEQMFTVAAGLAERGSFALSAGGDGPAVYGTYGPGQSVAAAPLYMVGRAVAAAFPPAGAAYLTRAAVGWLNPLVTAAAAALVALAALRLGYAPRPAAAAALIYGLATMAWPHSKTFFAEPLASALTFAAFVVPLGGQGAGGPRPGAGRVPILSHSMAARYVTSGLLAALACAVKLQAGLALPFLGLWVLLTSCRRQEAGDRPVPPASRLLPPAACLLPAALFGLGAALGLGVLALYQWAIFGSPLRSGYGAAGAVFDGNLAEGLYGLLLSPGKGIIWYAPPLALLPLGLAWLYRRDRGAALACGAMALATLLLYAKVIFWHGDGAWGPRYLNMALPFMSLPLAAVAEAALAGRRAPAAALAAALLLAAPVQLAGVAVNLNAYLGVQPDDRQRFFAPGQSPILGHLRLAGAQLGLAYDLALAPDSIVLRDGFSYSEGDRAAGQQLPRWALPSASIDLRPPRGGGLRVELDISGCRPPPVPPAAVAIRLDEARLGEVAACPPRRLSMLLPARPARLRLTSPAWRPADAGIERDGPLGLYLSRAAAWAGGAPLALRGSGVPIPPMPAGSVSLRRWTGDYRYGHWDVWPWYLAHSGLPARPTLALAAAWAGAALAMIGAGAHRLRGALRER